MMLFLIFAADSTITFFKIIRFDDAIIFLSLLPLIISVLCYLAIIGRPRTDIDIRTSVRVETHVMNLWFRKFQLLVPGSLYGLSIAYSAS